MAGRKTLAERDPGRGILGFMLRLPRWLYRLRLGWILGNRFLMLAHRGRRTGQTHQVVLEVVHYDKTREVFVVASAWGENADWYRNVQLHPEVTIHASGRKAKAQARSLTRAEAETFFREYAERHGLAFKILTWLLLGQSLEGSQQDCARLAESTPLVSLESRG